MRVSAAGYVLICGEEGDDGTVWVETEEAVIRDCYYQLTCPPLR
jgi:hypothetical protein